MRIKYRGKVGNDMKHETRRELSVSRRDMCSRMSIVNAVRFTFAQLFFGNFGFLFTSIPI